jgi:hypothetical protein
LLICKEHVLGNHGGKECYDRLNSCEEALELVEISEQYKKVSGDDAIADEGTNRPNSAILWVFFTFSTIVSVNYYNSRCVRMNKFTSAVHCNFLALHQHGCGNLVRLFFPIKLFSQREGKLEGSTRSLTGDEVSLDYDSLIAGIRKFLPKGWSWIARCTF